MTMDVGLNQVISQISHVGFIASCSHVSVKGKFHEGGLYGW